MELLKIHKNIEHKLDQFLNTNNVPNIIFHGPSGSGKKTLVDSFINKIYTSNQLKEEYIMKIDCEFGNGIKFIRNELKIFAKSNIIAPNLFKTIILINADKLTFDAQSALRRSIELYSTTTRFFMIVKNITGLLKPMISRFSKIYVGYPVVNNKIINLHSYIVENMIIKNDPYKLYMKKRENDLKKKINQMKNMDNSQFIKTINDLYNKGYSCLDIIHCSKNNKINRIYYKLKDEIFNEKLLMLNILFLLLRYKDYLEILPIIKYG